MRWPPWASDSKGSTSSSTSSSSANTTTSKDDEKDDSANTFTLHNSMTELGTSFTEFRTLIPTLILTSAIIFALRVRRRFLLRFPDAISIAPSYLRQRSIFGKVTSVGDGDNFRIYHTPGGRLVGWGWLPWRKVPIERKELKDNTIHIRLAGIDAPELAHFGRPAQPFAREAHIWLTNYLLHRRVRAYVYRHDQYQRVVASVYVRRGLDFPIPFRRRDVSYEMLKRGLATVYEAKSGAEFGGEKMERKYRRAERWAKTLRRGLWVDFGAKNKGKKNEVEWESPREYKTRMGMEDLGKNGVGGGLGHEDRKL